MRPRKSSKRLKRPTRSFTMMKSVKPMTDLAMQGLTPMPLQAWAAWAVWAELVLPMLLGIFLEKFLGACAGRVVEVVHRPTAVLTCVIRSKLAWSRLPLDLIQRFESPPGITVKAARALDPNPAARPRPVLPAVGQGQYGCSRAFSVCSKPALPVMAQARKSRTDRKSTRLNSSHVAISYAVFCLKKKKKKQKVIHHRKS